MVTGWRRLVGVAIASLALLQFAHTAHADDFKDCDSNEVQRMIDGCSAIIDAGTETAKIVARA